MWHKYKFYIWLAIAIVAIGVLESLKPKETVWIESYSKYDKIPYGSYILFERLEDLFSNAPILSYQSLNQSLNDSMTETNLVILNDNFSPSNVELETLLNFINNGNQALLICRTFSENLLDTLGLSMTMDFSQDSELNVLHQLVNDTLQYSIPANNIFFRTYFDSLNQAQPLGIRSDSLVNFVGLKYGEGKLYLNLTPSAFTNVSMLTDQNNMYVSDVISFLPDQTTIWDEHYKARKNYIKKTPFQQILLTDGLRQALYLLLIGTLLYMVFASKRKQRIIPVIQPKQNSTVDFIETMGQLYYNESNHKDIGMKRISYFLADLRDRHRIDTSELNKSFADKITSLSGVPNDIVEKLIENFKVIQSVDDVLTERIVEQEKLIESFYFNERKYGK